MYSKIALNIRVTLVIIRESGAEYSMPTFSKLWGRLIMMLIILYRSFLKIHSELSGHKDQNITCMRVHKVGVSIALKLRK